MEEEKKEVQENNTDAAAAATGEDKKSPDNKKWLYISLVLAAFVVTLGITAFFVVRSYFNCEDPASIKEGTGPANEEANKIEGQVRRLIDGVWVEAGKENIFPVAVMLDNHPDAYPQAGIASANLVYEAAVEGATSRYMAIFANDGEVETIGPVRSARPYFLDFSQEFSACYTHCGGSPEALVRISKEDILDMNEFYQGEYFWRAEDREAPHNVMTSNRNLRQFLVDENKEEVSYFSWQFKDASRLDPEGEYDNDISLSNFGVKWKFDPVANEYTRFLYDEVHEDANGGELKAKNIAVAYVDAVVIDDLLRLRMDTIGTGTALICFDGNCREGEWQKQSPSARMRFYNINGEEFIFNAGTTWIEVVRPEYEVKYETVNTKSQTNSE